MDKSARCGKRCVVFGCWNTCLNEGISLHKFPQDKSDFRQWVKFVKTKRKNWEVTKHSVLCSEHFEQDCYSLKHKLLANMGFIPPKKKFLLEHAIPTIHKPIPSRLISDQDEPKADDMDTPSSKKPNLHEKRIELN